MTTDTVGGVWTYALELARGLGAFGVEIQLATMGAPLSREQCEEARQIPNLSVFKSEYKLEWMEDPWADVREAGNWLLHLESRLKPDVVHLNNYVHSALPWLRPKLVVGHSCVLSWWQAVKKKHAPPGWNRYREKIARGIRAADLVIAPSQAMMTALDELYGPLPARRVIPNGRRPECFAPGVKEEFVLSVGRLWDEAKNVAALARVAPRLPWPVYVAGEEKHPGGSSTAVTAATAVTRFENVRPLGKLSSAVLASWFARASIYASPARYEPFGLSALEAALAGCALVLGDIPSLREIWQDAALFVSPDNEKTLEAALRETMTNQAHRRELANRARQRALQFSPQRMARAYLDTYAELLGKPQGRGMAKEEEIACAL
jgi:glycosyltransferase involved in cell wall biosynthesis